MTRITQDKERLDQVHQERMNEVQKQLENTIRANFDRAISRLSKVVPPKLYMPGQLMSLQEIKANILQLLDPTLTTLCTGDIMNIDFSKDLKTEYYDSLIAPQVSSITYAMICLTSDYLLGMLLYYVQKEFIFNFIMNDIVRPNVYEAIERVRLTLNRKDAMDMEIKKSDELSEYINDVVNEFMIKLNVDGFQEKVGKVIAFEFKDKASFIESMLNNSKFFVPDFIYTILMNGIASDVDIERASRFMQHYAVSHTEESLLELFKGYAKNSINMSNQIKNTLLERNAYQGIGNLQILDGLSFTEIKIANRIITFTVAEEDKVFIEESEVLKNIKSVVDKYHKYNTTIKLQGNDVVMTDSEGNVKSYNIRKEGLSKVLNDPFNLFKQAEFVKHIFTNTKQRSSLYQTGLTKSEDDSLILSISRSSINNKTPEERVQHRNSQIQKLVQMVKHDKHTMDEYTRLTTSRIDEIKYMNPTQSKTYVIENPARLLLILTETEYVYRQILKELAASVPKTN